MPRNILIKKLVQEKETVIILQKKESVINKSNINCFVTQIQLSEPVPRSRSICWSWNVIFRAKRSMWCSYIVIFSGRSNLYYFLSVTFANAVIPKQPVLF